MDSADPADARKPTEATVPADPSPPAGSGEEPEQVSSGVLVSIGAQPRRPRQPRPTVSASSFTNQCSAYGASLYASVSV